MADAAVQRKNMVESQVRPSDVTDRRVLRAMLDLPREAFVPPALREIAYMDEEVRLPGPGARALLAPRTFAKLVQGAELAASDSVLDVGAATGYSAAVIAKIAAKVTALEVDAGLAQEAAKALVTCGAANVSVVTGTLPEGHAAGAPYDAIILEGAVSQVPPGLLDQLKDGGRLVAILSEGRLGRVTVWRRIGTAYDSRPLFDAGGPRLPGFERQAAFVL